MMETVTVFELGDVLSFTVTAVGDVATVTPVIRSVVIMLSGNSRLAVAIELGCDEIAYGGCPPPMLTTCEPPAFTVTEPGLAVSCGAMGWVGELLLLLLQLDAPMASMMATSTPHVLFMWTLPHSSNMLLSHILCHPAFGVAESCLQTPAGIHQSVALKPHI